MPNKYLEQKSINVPKQKYKVLNWKKYNQSLRQRGNIDVWLSSDAIYDWYNYDRIYDGTGTPELYTDLAIITIHEIRKVFKLPLRQTQGFINSIFGLHNIDITCPDFSTLSRRLKKLNIKSPRYKVTDKPDKSIETIAIDSTGLKRFGRDEWHQEKHKVSPKRSWRKLHVAVDEKHIIQSATLTDRFASDDAVVEELLNQIDVGIQQATADGAYDKTPVYNKIQAHSPNIKIVIPPAKNAVLNSKNHNQRNFNICEIKDNGRMHWQKQHNYGRRNYSELSIQRYKRILGNAVQSRTLACQKQEAMIGCGVLNKMTKLGMPVSCKIK